MICIADLMERCEKLQPFTAINNDLACEFVAMVYQGQGIECIYEMLGLSPLKAKKLIRQSEIMMQCSIIYASCVTYKIRMRKATRRKMKIAFKRHEITDTFSEAKQRLLDSGYRWLRRSYAEIKFGKIAVPKGVCYIKHGSLAVVETIKPIVFLVNFYEVS
jgi:hypothetical protein